MIMKSTKERKNRNWYIRNLNVRQCLNEDTMVGASLELRGAWFILFMESVTMEQPGVMRINGEPAATHFYMGLWNVSREKAEDLLEEMEARGVFSRAIDDGAVYCRRITREFGSLGKSGTATRKARSVARAKGGPIPYSTSSQVHYSFNRGKRSPGFTRINGECVIGKVVEMEGEGLIVGDKRFAPHEIASLVFTLHKEDWQA